MADNNATCSICGKGYHLCLSCKDSIQLAPWKVHTDTSEHYKVFQIVRGLSTGVFNRDEAKIRFKNVNLRDMNEFRPHIKKIIEDVLKEDKPIAKVAEKVAIVEEINEVEIAEVKEEVVEKPIYSRKRSYKVEAE